MIAYYNEHDPKAAAWLRELIKRNLIAQGEVDERSIEDIRPEELEGYAQCHFFAGIGGWSRALRLAGWPDDRPVWTGSCPCQPFSAAGKGKGTADERHLWPAWHHLISECRPAVIFGEQVDAAIRHGWLDLVSADLEGIGYACGFVGLPAACVGAPHIRQRLWFVAESNCGTNNALLRGQQENTTSCSRSGEADGLLGQVAGRIDGCGILGNPEHQRRQQQPEDSRGDGAGVEPTGRVEIEPSQTGGNATGVMANAENPNGRCEQQPSGTRSGRREYRRGSAMGDPIGAGLEERNDERGDGGAQQQATQRAGGDAGELGHADDAGSQSRDESTETNGHRDTAIATGFWDACEWLPCRDGKARPVEPGVAPLAHGLSKRMVRVCAKCSEAHEKDSDNKDVRVLQEIAGASCGCLETEVLQPGVHGEGVCQDSEDKDGGEEPSETTVSSGRLRDVRQVGAVSSPAPQGPEPDEQRPREHLNTVRELSHGCSLPESCEECGEESDWLADYEQSSTRVTRLRGYGNAIVPQVAAGVIRAYLDYPDFMR
jgi:DNA (cytosine-5)-methyltransferase 1